MSDVADAQLISRRRVLRAGVVGGGIALGGPVLWRQTAHAAVAPAGRHLAFGIDPTRTMTVSWLTETSVRKPVLDLGLDTAYGRTIGAESRTVAGTASLYHHVALKDLEPGTTYHYRVRHDGRASSNGTFRTGPSAPAPFRFTAFGDQGVTDAAVSTTAVVQAAMPAFHLLAGDICYASANGGLTGQLPVNHATWDRWFAQVEPSARRVPWMTAVGNHEIEPGYGPQGYAGYLSRFTLPSGGPTPVVYAFRYANVAFLSLDANDASYEISRNLGYLEGAQERWLRQTLAAARADGSDIDFVVAQFHHCVYCSNAVHASDGGVRERWGPLFDAYGVDLVINGHNHCYERAHPVRRGEVTVQVPRGGTVKPEEHGTTYVTAGGGGQTAYPTFLPLSYVTVAGGARVPELPVWSALRSQDSSVLVVDVTPARDGIARMTVRALRPDGVELDAFVLERRGSRALAAAREAERVATA